MKDLRVNKDHKALPDLKGYKVYQALRVPKALKVHKDPKVHRAHKVCQALRDQLADPICRSSLTITILQVPIRLSFLIKQTIT
jgi:hypothetical protein